MAIYVDDERISWRGKLWCHLVSDSLSELHEFALQLGLKRSWFQGKSAFPHYDVTVSIRNKALALGAQMGDRQTIISCARKLKFQLHAEREVV